MSLQDDIFELEGHLDGTEYAAVFDRIYNVLIEMEKELEDRRDPVVIPRSEYEKLLQISKLVKK